MQVSSIPYKFATPWAADASSSFITAVIPATSSGAAASQQQGFPQATSEQPAAGGTPPSIQDFNGAFQYVTLWTQWLQAGGPIHYDSTFSTAIGGYPKGAVLMSSVTNGLLWINTVDNNTTNPDSSGTNWTTIGSVPITWSATQTFSTSPVLNNNVSLIGKSPGGSNQSLIGYGANGFVTLSGGTSGWVLNNNANSTNNIVVTDAGNVTVRGSLAVGSTVTTTDISATQGIVGGVTMQNGAVSATGGISGQSLAATNGNVSALGGRLVASLGATGTANGNIATLLGDFPFNSNNGMSMPNGFVMQWGAIPPIAPGGSVFVAYPTAFNHVSSLAIGGGAAVAGVPPPGFINSAPTFFTAFNTSLTQATQLSTYIAVGL